MAEFGVFILMVFLMFVLNWSIKEKNISGGWASSTAFAFHMIKSGITHGPSVLPGLIWEQNKMRYFIFKSSLITMKYAVDI